MCVIAIANGGTIAKTEMYNAFRQSKVDNVSVSTDDDYVKSLLQLFNNENNEVYT